MRGPDPPHHCSWYPSCAQTVPFYSASICFFQYGEVINSINPRDAYMHHWPGSPLTRVLTCCLLSAKPLPGTIFILYSTPLGINCSEFLVMSKKMDLEMIWKIRVIFSRPHCALIYIATTTVIYPPNGYTCNRVNKTPAQSYISSHALLLRLCKPVAYTETFVPDLSIGLVS